MSKQRTKEEIDKAFLNTNFGSQSNHEVLMEGLYKIIIGYENGRTCTCILLELGLIRTIDRNVFCLTDEGLKYYNRGESEKRAVAFAEWKDEETIHMDGMKGGTATIKSYSLPANISDITMKDGMKMNNHKWLTNDEVKLK